MPPDDRDYFISTCAKISKIIASENLTTNSRGKFFFSQMLNPEVTNEYEIMQILIAAYDSADYVILMDFAQIIDDINIPRAKKYVDDAKNYFGKDKSWFGTNYAKIYRPRRLQRNNEIFEKNLPIAAKLVKEVMLSNKTNKEIQNHMYKYCTQFGTMLDTFIIEIFLRKSFRGDCKEIFWLSECFRYMNLNFHFGIEDNMTWFGSQRTEAADYVYSQ